MNPTRHEELILLTASKPQKDSGIFQLCYYFASHQVAAVIRIFSPGIERLAQIKGKITGLALELALWQAARASPAHRAIRRDQTAVWQRSSSGASTAH
jgi:hypothetical protein